MAEDISIFSAYPDPYAKLHSLRARNTRLVSTIIPETSRILRRILGKPHVAVCRRTGHPPRQRNCPRFVQHLLRGDVYVRWLDRFSIDKALVDDFVRIFARGIITRGEGMRVFWPVPYANDAGIASWSQSSVATLMTAFVKVCARLVSSEI